MFTYQYDDGGRGAAGFKGWTGDCVPRAICIALDVPYRKTRKLMDAMTRDMTGGLLRSCNNGTDTCVGHRFMIEAGWKLRLLPPGSHLDDIRGVTGRAVIVMVRHWAALVDGCVHDTWDSRKSNRTRSGSPRVLGIYQKEG